MISGTWSRLSAYLTHILLGIFASPFTRTTQKSAKVRPFFRWHLSPFFILELISSYYLHNTSYLTESYVFFTLKMESVSKNTIFGLKMMVESGLEKIFLKFLHAGDYFPLLHKSAQNHKFSNTNNYFPTWRDFKINFSRPLFSIIFRPKIVFLDTDSNLRVKTMYESVK